MPKTLGGRLVEIETALAQINGMVTSLRQQLPLSVPVHEQRSKTLETGCRPDVPVSKPTPIQIPIDAHLPDYLFETSPAPATPVSTSKMPTSNVRVTASRDAGCYSFADPTWRKLG